MSIARRLRVFLPFFAVALAADQLSKAWARGALAQGPMPILDGTIFFQLGWNPGIAFSLLHGANARVVLAVFGLGVALGIFVWLTRPRAAAAPAGVLAGLALIAAGAAGNAIDRVTIGLVTDFAVVKLGSYRWPTFNVADAALLIGVAVYLISERLDRRVAREQDPRP